MHDQRGATSVEYGLIAVAIAAVVALVVFGLGSLTQGQFSNASTVMDTCIQANGAC